ncbi:MAG: hypothetical protein H5T62_16535 [Anaerolineae bacterium]|nr:hypothetical protein [Anaerolineae bacterium]
MRLTDRLWLSGLLFIDRLFGTRLALKEIQRRRERLSQTKAQLATIQSELKRLSELLDQVNIGLCLFHLRQRRLLIPARWLHFQSEDEEDTHLLEMLIEYLVKPRLAAIEVEEREGGYDYRLTPHWTALKAALADLDPDLTAWLEEMAIQENNSEPDMSPNTLV